MSLSWSVCFMQLLDCAVPQSRKCSPEIDLADVLIINNLPGSARGEDPPLVDDVGAVADAERLAHVVVGDQHADAALLQEADDALDVEHRDRVDAGERLVEQDEARARGERARDLARGAARRPTATPPARRRGARSTGPRAARRGGWRACRGRGPAARGSRARSPRPSACGRSTPPAAGTTGPRRARWWIGRRDRFSPSSSIVPPSAATRPDDHVEARRLAGAVRAEQADDLAARDVERDVVDDGARLVALLAGCAAESWLTGRRGAASPPTARRSAQLGGRREFAGAASSVTGGAALSSAPLPGPCPAACRPSAGTCRARARPGRVVGGAAASSGRPSALNSSVCALYEM